MKKTRLFAFIIITLSILSVGLVHASETQSYVVVQTTRTYDYNISQEFDDGVEIQNVTTMLVYWNGRMNWGLSQEQIREYSIEAEKQILKNLTSARNNWYHIKNLTKFDEEIGAIIGLNDAEISAFIIEDRKQLQIDHMNYFKETPIATPGKMPPFSSTGVSINSATDTFKNEQTLQVTPRNTSLSGFDFPLGICSVIICLLIIATRRG